MIVYVKLIECGVGVVLVVVVGFGCCYVMCLIVFIFNVVLCECWGVFGCYIFF